MAASSGMDFGKRILEKYGWEKGKGLGRRENGLTQPVKVSLKMNSQGLGFNPSHDHTTTWWEKAYKKAADNLEVKSRKKEVQFNAKVDLDISADRTTRPPNAILDTMDYKSFIKRATLNRNTVELVEPDSTNSEPDATETESASQISDEDLMAACEGRTAHKGARHGLTQSGKLSRLLEQERKEAALLHAAGLRAAHVADALPHFGAIMDAWKAELAAKGVLPPPGTTVANLQARNREQGAKGKKKQQQTSESTPESNRSAKVKKRKKTKREVPAKAPSPPPLEDLNRVKVKNMRKPNTEVPALVSEEKPKKKRKTKNDSSKDSLVDDEVKLVPKEKKAKGDQELATAKKKKKVEKVEKPEKPEKPAALTTNANITSDSTITKKKPIQVEEVEKKKKPVKKVKKILGGAGDATYTTVHSPGGGETLVPIPETPDRLKGLPEFGVRRRKILRKTV